MYVCNKGLSISWFQKYGTGIRDLCKQPIFFFSVESLSLTKMDRLTITQHIKIIKTYYKNSDFTPAAYRLIRGDYGLHNRSTTQVIGKIGKKLEETGVVTNIERPVHHRFARSTENIPIVNESVTEDQNVSIPRRSQKLGLS